MTLGHLFTTLAFTVLLLGVAIAAIVLGRRWVAPDGHTMPRRLLAIAVFAGVCVLAGAIVGVAAKSPAITVFAICGLVALSGVAYRQFRPKRPPG